MTLIAAIIDRSGSMGAIKQETEGAFDHFVAEQAQNPEGVTMTLAQFDNEYELVYANKPITEVPKLDLIPRGTTALFDAVGRTVTAVGADLAKLAEEDRPGKVIVVILTDGFENASQEWTGPRVQELVKTQRDTYNWDFVFLGAGLDAAVMEVGAQLGVLRSHTMSYSGSGEGVTNTIGAASAYVTRSRRGDRGGFTQSDRDAARGDS